MRPTVKTLCAACASALLVACADMGPPGRTGISADEAYVLARQQHLAARLPAAIDNYQAALRTNPRHLNATNGLATLYAEQGNLPKAIGMWRALTLDTADSAATAYIHSNLGYAYLLNRDYQLAIASLERACVLDPLGHRAWRHLGEALAKVGQDERARRMLHQAATLEQHDLRGDYALTGTPPLPGVSDIDSAAAAGSVAASPAPAAPPSAMPAATAAPELPATELHQTGSAMFELRRPRPAAAARPPLRPVANKPEEEVVEPTVRVEIRNGNGVTGMARSLSAAMTDAHTQVVRLSNQKGFGVEHTRVEFQPGFAAAAARLAEQFGGTAVQATPGANIDIRLVLGQDLARSKRDARRVIRAALSRAARAG
ncbi:LytR C-terminal domain-containing protein [Massilia sp. DWR3-1-1]|uniref:LytR C-terminal domain-containing protein n=1 Tax=Massilia sp. DWR3-1-1 TaxID=2804559 RepID=UPI003CF2E5CE